MAWTEGEDGEEEEKEEEEEESTAFDGDVVAFRLSADDNVLR